MTIFLLVVIVKYGARNQAIVVRNGTIMLWYAENNINAYKRINLSGN
jgi:hypothetical protein